MGRFRKRFLKMKIVFDTYAWIEFFEGTEKGRTVKKYLMEDRVLTPSIALLELSYKADREGWNFKKHLNFIRLNSEITSINEEFVLTFGRLYNKIKKQVKNISFADIIILHTAILNNAKVLTGDEHIIKTGKAIAL